MTYSLNQLRQHGLETGLTPPSTLADQSSVAKYIWGRAYKTAALTGDPTGRECVAYAKNNQNDLVRYLHSSVQDLASDYITNLTESDAKTHYNQYKLA
jgi:hypothetical protein